METFRDRFRFLVTASGLSQAAVARGSGISEQAAAFFISGARLNPRIETARRLASFFGTTVGWLLAGEGDAPTAESVALAVRTNTSSPCDGGGADGIQPATGTEG